MSRQDVLLPFILFLFISFVVLLWIIIRLLQEKSTRLQHIVFGVGTLLIFTIAWSANWTPGRQLRRKEPWHDWMMTSDQESYEFAHSIKLPEEPKADNFYKTGLFGIWGRTTSSEYFKHLCEVEAGEFVYKTVEDVEGIYQMRPRQEAISYKEMQDRYAMEDPYGYIRWEARNPHTLFANRKGYKYFESKKAPDWKRLERHGEKYLANEPVDQGMKYWRYWPDDSFEQSNAKNVNSLDSRYGFTWRGIKRPHDRENGIAGGELIILDLVTNEVLAVRRGFAKSGRVKSNKTGINWEVTHVCPMLNYRKGWPKDVDFTNWLVKKVLRPFVNKGPYTNKEN